MMMRHTVKIERKPTESDPVTLKINATLQSISASAKCLIEGMSSKQRESLIGRISSPQYRVTWISADIREGDRLVWTGGPGATGKAYIVHEVTDDTTRPTAPYKTAVLAAFQGKIS